MTPKRMKDLVNYFIDLAKEKDLATLSVELPDFKLSVTPSPLPRVSPEISVKPQLTKEQLSEKKEQQLRNSLGLR